MPRRSEQDLARLTDEALGVVMAPFPSWGSARKKGQDQKYFYKSLLLICSSLLSRQMCAASSTARTQRRACTPRSSLLPSPLLLSLFLFAAVSSAYSNHRVHTHTYAHYASFTSEHCNVRTRTFKRFRARADERRVCACATTMLALGASGTGERPRGRDRGPAGLAAGRHRHRRTPNVYTLHGSAPRRHRHRRREYRRRSVAGSTSEKRPGRRAVVGRHRETARVPRRGRASRASERASEAATIIFHRQKRKGRMPFISPGSVGSHVVWCRCCL